MLVTQAYKFALDPTPRQQRALWSHCGAARRAYNWGLDLVKQRLDQRTAGMDVEVPWTLPALRREWNQAKDQVAPWWRANSKEAYNSGLDALARGLANWADSKRGRRKGPKVGFPNFKAKHRTRPACRFTTGAIRVGTDRHHVTLPRIGRLRTHESTRKLARRCGPRAPDGTRRAPSAHWQHAKRRLARAHARVANVRRDGLHKLTTKLAGTYEIVVVEDLNVAGMVRRQCLARAISDAGFGELRRQLSYKCRWYGSDLMVADRWSRRRRPAQPAGQRKPSCPSAFGSSTATPAEPEWTAI